MMVFYYLSNDVSTVYIWKLNISIFTTMIFFNYSKRISQLQLEVQRLQNELIEKESLIKIQSNYYQSVIDDLSSKLSDCKELEKLRENQFNDYRSVIDDLSSKLSDCKELPLYEMNVSLKKDLQKKDSKISRLTNELQDQKWCINELQHKINILQSNIIPPGEFNDSNRYAALNNYIKNLEHEFYSKDPTLGFSSINLDCFPYIASFMADYHTRRIDIMIQELSWGNNVSRKNKVASLTEIKKETKSIIEQCKIAIYQLEYLKELFPSIDDILDTDFKDLDLDLNIQDHDPVRKYISKNEYHSLSESDRNQLALDRYIESHHKNKWQIGRDYELYVGYKYSLSGYSIDYFGSYNGLNDLGRDLIAKRGDQTLIIQCKYWSKEKLIREKHIAQLYGTYICYCLEKNVSFDFVKAVFITSTILSEEAKKFCNYLKISYKENYDIGDFPRIKCNIGVDEFGAKSKIYHLPMDQQYDKVKICKSGECFVYTVNEAEQLGFRRAYKWHGQ